MQDNNSGPKTPIRIFAKCLRPDIEYKTLSAGHQTTCRELIWTLLSKYKMRHRDPNLFYLTMDISICRTGVPLQRTLTLDDDSRPAQLKSCHPWGDCKFTLQMRKGGLVKVHDSILMAESKYKCLLIAEHTTVEEVVRILLHCYNLERIERVERFCLVEQCQSRRYERKLHPADRPAEVQSLWPNPSHFHFVLRHQSTVAPFSLEQEIGRDLMRGAHSAGVSPVGSEIEAMDVTSSSSSTISTSDDDAGSIVMASPESPSKAPPLTTPPTRTATNFKLRGQVTSIHECGLPPPPELRPKPSPQSLLLFPASSSRASLGSLSSRGSRASSASFHDYENYFYI